MLIIYLSLDLFTRSTMGSLGLATSRNNRIASLYEASDTSLGRPAAFCTSPSNHQLKAISIRETTGSAAYISTASRSINSPSIEINAACDQMFHSGNRLLKAAIVYILAGLSSPSRSRASRTVFWNAPFISSTWTRSASRSWSCSCWFMTIVTNIATTMRDTAATQGFRRRNRQARSIGPSAPVGMNRLIRSTSALIPSAEAYRSDGMRLRHFLTTLRMRPCTMLQSTLRRLERNFKASSSVSPFGYVPVIKKYAIPPIPYTSTAIESALGRICSGAMHKGDPATV